MQTRLIFENIKELDETLDKFDGNKNSIEYQSLDEKFTKTLEALDGIDPVGFVEVREKRKILVDSVQKSITILESKSQTQPEETSSMDIQDFPSISSFIDEAAQTSSEQISTKVYIFYCLCKLCTYINK